MGKPHRKALCWIRRDLRLDDHSALAKATELADQVAIVFVFDISILDKLEDKDDKRVTFIHESLKELDRKLQKLGSKLVVLHGDPINEIPRLAASLKADLVVVASDNEPSAIHRDILVARKLSEFDIKFTSVLDVTIRQKGEILNQSHLPFKVYTPFARAWRTALQPDTDLAKRESDLSSLIPAAELEPFGHDWELSDIGFVPSTLVIKPGEDAAHRMLAEFLHRIDHYNDERDYPAKNGTSMLSVHLRFGTLSVREAFRSGFTGYTKGRDKWVAELIWREFYQDILANFPAVVEKPFQSQYEAIEYPGSEEHYTAWCEGTTGYPIVDAAMRCLNQTGTMHNRLRMVVASFLTKDLLVDYRKGEAYFARKLLDFDLASNNGGWQWAASTGCDAQPYFRIFNPALQSIKFDSEGIFIKEWLPELAELPPSVIHSPSTMDSLSYGIDYPAPIVDHSQQRDKAIALMSLK